MKTERYQPSNGTEGMIFYERWCDRCHRERHGRECSIYTRTMAYDLGDKKYPREWVKDIGEYPGNPRCTAFELRRAIVRSNVIRDKRQETMGI